MNKRKGIDAKGNYFLQFCAYNPVHRSFRLCHKKRLAKSLKLKHWSKEELEKFGDVNCICIQESNHHHHHQSKYLIGGNKKKAVVEDMRTNQKVLSLQDTDLDYLNLVKYNEMLITHAFGKPLEIIMRDEVIHRAKAMPSFTLNPLSYATSCKVKLVMDKLYFCSSSFTLVCLNLNNFSETKIANSVEDFCVTNANKIITVNRKGGLSVLNTSNTFTLPGGADSYRCIADVGNSVVVGSFNTALKKNAITLLKNNLQVIHEVTFRGENHKYLKYLKAFIFRKAQFIISARFSSEIDILVINKNHLYMLAESVKVASDSINNVINGFLIHENKTSGRDPKILVFGYKIIAELVLRPF